MDRYVERAQALEVEIAALQSDQLTCTDPKERAAIDARLASAVRSLDWYQSRIPRRITALNVVVHEDVSTAERI